MKTKTQFVGVILKAGMDETTGEPRVVIGADLKDLQGLTTNPLFKLCRIEILEQEFVKAEN